MSRPNQAVIELVRTLGYERRDKAFQLSSGEWSHDYIDGKRAMASGKNLKLVAEALLDQANQAGVIFEAVGGPTMGADPAAHAVALLTGAQWFSVRKTPKGHDKQSLIEGAQLTHGMRVLLLDDVVTTGTSILEALDAVAETGAEVVMASALVDRGNTARIKFAERGVLYQPLATYEDFEISPIGQPA